MISSPADSDTGFDSRERFITPATTETAEQDGIGFGLI